MDVNDIDPSIMPIPSPEEKRKTNSWDVEPLPFPATSPAGQQGASNSQRVIPPATLLPSTVHSGERQRANLLRQTVPPTHNGSPSRSVSPELARLIEHREQLAAQATRQLRALVAVPPQQQQGNPGPAATATKAQPEKRKQKSRGL